MKKSAIFILILLIVPTISAIEFDMKTNFSQGETFMAKVSGYFLEPILKENIFFYRGHVRIPLKYNVAEINNEFYIYAMLADKEPNNYSLAIKNVRYMVGSQISEEDITKDIEITIPETEGISRVSLIVLLILFVLGVIVYIIFRAVKKKKSLKNKTSDKDSVEGSEKYLNKIIDLIIHPFLRFRKGRITNFQLVILGVIKLVF